MYIHIYTKEEKLKFEKRRGINVEEKKSVDIRVKECVEWKRKV